MLNNLSHQSNSSIKPQKSGFSKNNWKSGILILTFGSLILPIANLPLLGSLHPLLTPKVVAQETPTATPPQETKLVKIGILSKEDTDLTIAQWQPTIDYLSKTIPGYTFELVPTGFEGMYDLANSNGANFYIINSGMYVDFEARHGANRIATLKNLRLGKPYTQFGAVIITKADRDDIDTVKDLKNKNFMAVSPIAFGGWQMAEGVLYDEGIKEPEKFFKQLDYGETHENVIKAVASGQVDAGTIRTDALERAVQRGEAKLEDFKIINQQTTEGFPFVHSTPLYPEWPFAAAKGNDTELNELVAKALFNMSKDSPAAKASKSEGWTVPLNYRPVHELFIDLNIAPYDEIGRLTFVGFLKKYIWLNIAVVTIVIGLIANAFYTQRKAIIQEKQNQESLNVLNKSLEENAAEQKKQREELEKAVVGLMEALEPAADGDLTVRAQLSEGDVGIIADLFNAIVENLKDIALQVKDSAGQVGSSLKENESSIREIAEQAIVEAEQIQATLSSVEEMSTSIKDVASNAEKTAIISNDAFMSAKEGNTVMDRTVDSIQGLRTTIGDTAKKIKRLGESAQQISQVVALIDEIALKTNLLAINASVEAARAGELGQGFTAVAEQVGALAEQSANATKEIAQLITGIQQETQEVVVAMETGTSQVVDSTRLVEATKVSLSTVLIKSQEIDLLMKSISQATISQAETSQAVTEIMMLNSKSSQERSKSSGQVAQAIQSTTAILGELQESVAQFKVSETEEVGAI
ncbi:PhnD/SsuA/transferrin family substrate-binding protein [Waterburya agarophytonicola K14]|uniref:PhnD/SsuA/transferrin family substrate-binding protein n=1 Tax=Waterburya agarophytonicola KI4 TaxID=2874699 RepID=A0A964BTG3_9CYAN|nr:PhnD/SsuA/transferrin family substrate-binding protein [Waterburya agarophytonicola]MCC0177545.1 PhnD/SsuA/transferrin family substrate-binding protein [Waterburya agarophytonicola KI4]